MTIVYVLTSSTQDYYKEQFLISAYSLRRENAQKVLLLTDDKTAPLLPVSLLKELKIDVHIVPFDDNVSTKERSRLIKTSIADYVDVPFLYLDCDTVICGSLAPIEDIDCKVGGVLDCHVLIDEHIHRRYFLGRDKKIGFWGTQALGYNINGGVLFCKDAASTKSLFSKWNELWKYSAYKKNDFHDQSALAQAVVETGNFVALLGGEWNCQLEHGGLQYLQGAKVLHYYSSEQSGRNYSPYYKFAQPSLWEEVRQHGFTSHLQDLVTHAKTAFCPTHLVSDKRIVAILQSPVLFTVADLKQHLPCVFDFIENCTEGIRRVAKKVAKLFGHS